MIVCKVCGNRNNDEEEFCTSCGRYLAWSGEHVDVAPEAEPELVPADAFEETRPPGFFRRLAISLHLVVPAPAPPPIAEAAPASAGPPRAGAVPTGEDDGGELDEGVYVLGALPKAATASLPAGSAAGLTAGSGAAVSRGESVLVVPEVVGANGETSSTTMSSGEATAPMALIGGTADAAPVLRPRRPGESAAQLPVLPPLPGREPPPSERATVLRRPTEVVAKPRSRRARSTQLAGVPEPPSTPSPGDVFCSRCNQFNSPTRVYCRRCGLELSPRAVQDDDLYYEPLSWWQRHSSHDVHVVSAGARPGRWGKIVSGGGSQGRALRIISRVGMVFIAAFFVLTFVGPYKPSLQNWYVNTYHSLYNYLNASETGVNASGASATSSAPNHDAFLAVDGASNTYWESAVVPQPASSTIKRAAAKSSGHRGAAPVVLGPALPCRLWPPGCTPLPKSVIPGVGQVLTINFSPAVSINRLAWLNGASGSLANFDAIGRPHEVVLILHGNRRVVQYLQDTQSLQTFKISVKNLSTMQVRILSTYPGSVRAIAITEIEFFHRQ